MLVTAQGFDAEPEFDFKFGSIRCICPPTQHALFFLNGDFLWLVDVIHVRKTLLRELLLHHDGGLERIETKRNQKNLVTLIVNETVLE